MRSLTVISCSASRLLWCFYCVVLLIGTGCTPLSETEQEYFDRRDEERENLETFGETLLTGREMGAAIDKVKEYVREGSSFNMEQWVRGQLTAEDGNIVADRWEATQKAGDRYEVKFKYTVLHPDNSTEKKGFAWIVDNVVDTVRGPRIVSGVEFNTQTENRSRDLQRERKREHEKLTLE